MNKKININNFSELGLNEQIIDIIEKNHIKTPTPVQLSVIPTIISGRDLMAIAQTGSGKTLSFLLPLLQKELDNKLNNNLPNVGIGTIIILPTRELALQTRNVIKNLTKDLNIKIITAIGGEKEDATIKSLTRYTSFFITTPGRFIKTLGKVHIEKNFKINAMVLDEVDRLIDMGFAKQTLEIIKALPTSQRILMTATKTNSLAAFYGKTLYNPAIFELTSFEKPHDNIEHFALVSDDYKHKIKQLIHLITLPQVKKAIIFTATQKDVEILYKEVFNSGYPVCYIHGGMGLAQRKKAMKEFMGDKYSFIIASDLASRGLDILDVDTVINFDLPTASEDYIHRIGRTGRAGNKGMAYSLIGKGDRLKLEKIEQLLKRSITRLVIKGLENKSIRYLSSQKPKNLKKVRVITDSSVPSKKYNKSNQKETRTSKSEQKNRPRNITKKR